MTQSIPSKAYFANGEANQTSASFYLHGSPDGGEDVYSVGGAPAYWLDADGGIGLAGSDTSISFAGTEADDAGTGGPYSSRLGGLLLRPQLASGRDYATEISFSFTGTIVGERVAVFCRVIPANLTHWYNYGPLGTGSPNYFRTCIQGIGLEIDDAGAAVLFKYSAAGARTTIATMTTAVGTTTHTLSLKVTGKPGTITALLDGVDALPASSYTLTTGDAGTRGHAGLALSRTALASYPVIDSFKVTDYAAPSTPVVKLLDEWTRTPEIEGTIVSTGATGDIAKAVHKIWEWGGHKLAFIGTDTFGPSLRNGARRYGPRVTASAIPAATRVTWLDLWLRGAPAATQVAVLQWTWDALAATTPLLTGKVGIGCAVRATKSAGDTGSTPTLAASTGYIFRLVFDSPSAYFEIVRVVAGTSTRLDQKRPVNAANFKQGEAHTFKLHVEDSGINPVLNAVWEDNAGLVHKIFDNILDDHATRILAVGTVGIWCAISGMGGLNPAFMVRRFEVGSSILAAPDWSVEATIEGAVPFAPEFSEQSQPVYITLQDVTERLYIQSRPEFIRPRAPFSATWMLEEADGQTMYDYLVARQKDRQGFTITVDDVATNFVMTDEQIELVREAGGIWTIGPVELLEVL